MLKSKEGVPGAQHYTLFVIRVLSPFFAIFLILTLNFVKTGTILPVEHWTRDYLMTLFTIIALPFPYLVIYSLWPFMVWTKNTFLWIRKLYWMGHRTLNEPFEWSVVHPPVYCVIINYCLLTHLLLSPTPIVSTYCSIVMATKQLSLLFYNSFPLKYD